MVFPSIWIYRAVINTNKAYTWLGSNAWCATRTSGVHVGIKPVNKSPLALQPKVEHLTRRASCKMLHFSYGNKYKIHALPQHPLRVAPFSLYHWKIFTHIFGFQRTIRSLITHSQEILLFANRENCVSYYIYIYIGEQTRQHTPKHVIVKCRLAAAN